MQHKPVVLSQVEMSNENLRPPPLPRTNSTTIDTLHIIEIHLSHELIPSAWYMTDPQRILVHVVSWGAVNVKMKSGVSWVMPSPEFECP